VVKCFFVSACQISSQITVVIVDACAVQEVPRIVPDHSSSCHLVTA